MPLNIYTSNRMENLVSALADVLAQPISSPLAPEVIVMQSKGMQRWLAMELAKRFGVWANCDYPFPNSMVWRLFSQILPDIPDTSAFEPELLTWKIMGLLPSFLDSKPFAPLLRYLSDDRDGLKRFQLVERIADTFDQYTLFRPEMLLAWEAGAGQGDEEWQALLWRELVRGGSGRHRGRLKEDFCQQIEAIVPAECGIPERIALFGISYLPGYHMDILAATARVTEVNLFLLSPTREYWSDIISSRAMARLSPEDRSLRSEGNSLLVSLGKLGRDFSDMTIEIGDLAVIQEDLYDDPGEGSLLHTIQSRILNLTGAGEGGAKYLLEADDHSVQIHSCHSPLREIEVLHDNLLDLLEREQGLEPRHIVVMTPDIETYAPYVAMVFEGAQDPNSKIPYSIADRSLASEGQVAAVTLKLLGVPGSRLTVVQLLDILEMPPVSRRFELNEEDLENIRRWLGETRVRWGMDEHDRELQGVPGYRDNSWRAGLDRLLLGYAMPDEKGRLFNGLLPYDEMEGSGVRSLGKLVEFVDRIAELADSFGAPRTLEGWCDYFRAMLADFIAVEDDTARELDAVAGVVGSMAELGEQSGFGELVAPAVTRSWFTNRLRQVQKGLGFMTGGVTFCAMLPMRSIPFRVVALIGMSDGAFPRQSRPPGFDLIARNPRRGDRSLRDEDRYLFLEAILSARDCLYLSYVGQSIKDNSEVPPSVLVSELLDAIDRDCTVDGERITEERLVTRHRLQAFSRDYFSEGSPLFSYSAENCAALIEKNSAVSVPSAFMAVPLAEPGDEWRDIPLAKLISFFRNPAQFFMENRLGIRMEDVDQPLEEREPFGMEGLESYSLKHELLKISLQGGNPGEYLPVARARGILPPAQHGRILFEETVENVEAFARVVRGEIGNAAPLPRLDFQLDLDRFRLNGSLDQIWPERMIRYRCAKLKAKDQMQVWLEHLVLNALQPEGYPRETVLIMVDGSLLFGAVDDAPAILKTLLDLYWQGLSMPLRFFPASSMAYAHKLEWNLERAIKAWEGGFNGFGECDEPGFRLCFGSSPPFDEEFERIAHTVLESLIGHQM
ncbi:MAG: exodeoxyribonuclease V subunit gamma [Desulfuromonadales bacterium]|nr:exodeoxyribonuclease V subunit gamma [Desulfuromonadales bacterium]